MLNGLLYGLLTAEILVWFGVDEIFINALQPFFPKILLTDDLFYFVLGMLGIIGGALEQIK